VNVRIAIVAESFPPDVNGVAHCTLRVAEHLVARGHHPLVIAPAPARGAPGSAGPFPCPVVRLRSVPVPRYRNFRVAVPGPPLRSAVAGHRAELVHLASPFILGAGRARLPTIAVYQTDMPGYARVYGTGRLGEAAAWGWLRRIHNAADRTLAPSTASADSLRANGVERVWVWGRGVDTRLFDPGRRSERLRRELALSPTDQRPADSVDAVRPQEPGTGDIPGRARERGPAARRRCICDCHAVFSFRQRRGGPGVT